MKKLLLLIPIIFAIFLWIREPSTMDCEKTEFALLVLQSDSKLKVLNQISFSPDEDKAIEINVPSLNEELYFEVVQYCLGKERVDHSFGADYREGILHTSSSLDLKVEINGKSPQKLKDGNRIYPNIKSFPLNQEVGIYKLRLTDNGTQYSLPILVNWIDSEMIDEHSLLNYEVPWYFQYQSFLDRDNYRDN